MSGTLYGIGVGPGDPELMTLKAVRILRQAPVLAYPAPLNGDSLARSIASPHIQAGKTEIAIRLPFSPDRGDSESRYDDAAETLSAHLEGGRDVALLCLGDPLFYGTFAQVLARIAGRFPVSVVPGVTSLAAASAAVAMPVAMGDESLAVIPATLDENAIASRVEAADCAAIVKIGRNLGKVRGVLTRLGLAGEARYVEFASAETQRIRNLAEVAEDEAVYFAIVLVRKRAFP